MRTALRPNTNRIASASSKSFPAPVGGWNAKASLAAMGEDEASVLINWFPESSYVRLRGGQAQFADTQQANKPVESLMTYTGIMSQKVFAAVNGKIFNVTNGGPIASPDLTGLSNNRWQHLNFGNGAGNFLIIANGADNPKIYDNTSWANMTLAGDGINPFDITKLFSFCCYQERLFVLDSTKLGFWYLPVNSISGAMDFFDLSSFCGLGGSMQWVATWSRDAGDGADDYIVFGTSEGEVLIYSGVDPSDATQFAISSIYRIGHPIGSRCTLRIASDLIIITKEGFTPLSKVLLYSKAVAASNISNNIQDAVSNVAQLYAKNFGWQPFFFSNKNMALFNIPLQEGQQQVQYVINTQTKAWGQFQNLNANCWEQYDDNLYFGGNDGKVYQAETGTDDNGNTIDSEALCAYSYFGAKAKIKRFTLARPVMRSTGLLLTSVKMSRDFQYTPPDLQYSANETTGAAWDVTAWDTSDWADSFRVNKSLKTITGIGNAAALGIKTSTKFQEIQWLSTDIYFELGGFI